MGRFRVWKFDYDQVNILFLISKHTEVKKNCSKTSMRVGFKTN